VDLERWKDQWNELAPQIVTLCKELEVDTETRHQIESDIQQIYETIPLLEQQQEEDNDNNEQRDLCVQAVMDLVRQFDQIVRREADRQKINPDELDPKISGKFLALVMLASKTGVVDLQYEPVSDIDTI